MFACIYVYISDIYILYILICVVSFCFGRHFGTEKKPYLAKYGCASMVSNKFPYIGKINVFIQRNFFFISYN